MKSFLTALVAVIIAVVFGILLGHFYKTLIEIPILSINTPSLSIN